MKKRCAWTSDKELLNKYHDNEWGVPVHDDQKHFEFLLLEVMQAGLNWTMILNKREVFRKAFDNFDYKKISLYDDKKIQEILLEPGIIKSEKKILAIINNANKFIEIIKEFATFDNYIWKFSDYKSLVYKKHQLEKTPSKNELSDIISKDLKKRGFKYIGSITIYSHLQAAGIIIDHDADCFKYDEIIKNYFGKITYI